MPEEYEEETHLWQNMCIRKQNHICTHLRIIPFFSFRKTKTKTKILGQSGCHRGTGIFAGWLTMKKLLC